MRAITGCGVVESNSRELAPLEPGEVAGELDHHHLEPEAEAEARDRSCSRAIAGGRDHALDAPLAEPAGDDDAVEVAQPVGRREVGHELGVDPVDARRCAPVVEAGVAQRLDHREVGVGQVDVLADDPDPHRALGGRRPGRRRASHSLRSIGWSSRSMPSVSADVRRRAPPRGGRAGSRRCCAASTAEMTASIGHVAEERDLALQPVGDRAGRCGRRSRRAGCPGCAAR